MGASVNSGTPDREAFARFIAGAEPRLRQALMASYGPVDGREATVDALSWAWEHWDRLSTVANKVGYLYRVGQSSVRRYASRPIPTELLTVLEDRFPDVEPGLVPALARLPVQQRTVVVLVHGYGWPQATVADTLGIAPSTVHVHLDRAIERLRAELEVRDAC